MVASIVVLLARSISALGLLGLSCAFAADSEDVQKLIHSDTTPYWDASKLDPLGDTKYQRYQVPDGYYSPFGAQIHPICFQYAERYFRIPRPVLEYRFERLLRATFENFTYSCMNTYPELWQYGKEWISHLRRIVFTCSHKTSKQMGGAFAQSIGFLPSMYFSLDEAEYDGIDWGQSQSDPTQSPLANFNRIDKNYKSIIAFSRDALEGIATQDYYPAGGDYMVDTLTHELLHNTHANNRIDHNEVETRRVFASQKCGGEDIITDRINMISALCTNNRLYQETEDVRVQMFDRISSCGMNRGCTQLFRQKQVDTHDLMDLLSRPWSQMKGLPKDVSQMLCNKIYSKGACLYDLKNSGEMMTASNKAINSVGDKIRKKFYAIINPTVFGFNSAFQKMFPHFMPNLRRNLGDGCFSDVLKETRSGSLVVSEGAIPKITDPTPQKWFNRIADEIIAKVKSTDSCNAVVNTAESSFFKYTAFRRLVPSLKVFFTGIYYDLIEQRTLHRSENWADIYTYRKSTLKYGTETDPAVLELARLLGSDLLIEYLEVLGKQHYKSSGYQCAQRTLYK